MTVEVLVDADNPSGARLDHAPHTRRIRFVVGASLAGFAVLLLTCQLFMALLAAIS